MRKIFSDIVIWRRHSTLVISSNWRANDFSKRPAENLEKHRVVRSGWVRRIRCRYRCYTGNSCRNPRDDMANVERGLRVAAQGRTESIHHRYPQRDAEIPSQLVSSNRRVSCTVLKRASLVIIPISTLSVSELDIHKYDLSAFWAFNVRRGRNEGLASVAFYNIVSANVHLLPRSEICIARRQKNAWMQLHESRAVFQRERVLIAPSTTISVEEVVWVLYILWDTPPLSRYCPRERLLGRISTYADDIRPVVIYRHASLTRFAEAWHISSFYIICNLYYFSLAKCSSSVSSA